MERVWVWPLDEVESEKGRGRVRRSARKWRETRERGRGREE